MLDGVAAGGRDLGGEEDAADGRAEGADDAGGARGDHALELALLAARAPRRGSTPS